MSTAVMSYDYVIVGGGSAGTVLANRLSASGRQRVLLVEAGPDTPPGAEPADILDTFHSPLFRPTNMWPGLAVYWQPIDDGGARRPAPRRYEQARIMGGGSSVNAMNAVRAWPADFGEWVAAGAVGWAWDDVLPYFRKLENDLDFDGALHGRDGPIPIRRHRRDDWPPFCRAAATALADAGFDHVADANADFRDGYCSAPMNSLPAHRVSTAMGYLDQMTRQRQNLTILANTRVEALLFQGRQAKGVRVAAADGPREIRAREVIVAAGALFSPALLLAAGIGPARELADQGVTVLVDLPGTGRNLQEHPMVALAAHLRRPGVQPRSLRPVPNISLRFSSGVADCPASDMYMTLPNKVSWHPLGRRLGGFVVSLYKPWSRGRVSLDRANAHGYPRVEFNLLADRRDLERLKRGLRFARTLLDHAAVRAVTNDAFPASFSERVRTLNTQRWPNWLLAGGLAMLLDGPTPVRGALIRHVVGSGVDLDHLLGDDAALEHWIGENATGFYHPVGTCRMGAQENRQAVVDPAGRVHGVSGLRVADASVMPTIVRANTNLTTIMIAEKLSAQILAES